MMVRVQRTTELIVTNSYRWMDAESYNVWLMGVISRLDGIVDTGRNCLHGK